MLTCLPNHIENTRIASFLFKSLSDLLVSSFRCVTLIIMHRYYASLCCFSDFDAKEVSILSPVISSALLCEDTVCDTSSLQLRADAVRIELHIPDVRQDLYYGH